MHCTTNQQQKQQQILSTTATTSAAASAADATFSAQPKSAFTTAQNCLNNFEPQKPTLMIKSIESSTNRTEWDEKEEKENCSLLQRRESVPEETAVVKLNTIEEHLEQNTLTLSNNLNLKITRNDSQTSISIIADTDANTSNCFYSSAEELRQQNTTTTSDSFNDNLIFDTSGVSATGGQSNQTTENNLSTNVCSSNFKQKRTSSPTASPTCKNSKSKVNSSLGPVSSKGDEDSVSKSSDTSGELVRDNSVEKSKSCSRLSERAKKKSWYNVLYPNYKSRSQDFKKLFREVPEDERLIVDYSCALQRDILVQGRLYVSQNYVCFHANIFRWETYLSIKWKDVTSITKEKTALVIPNAISICTAREKYFFTTFATRDKTFLMLFRVWQNTLMNKQMLPQEMWQWVHNCYGDELGLTTDDEDYIDPTKASNDGESDLDFVSAVDETNVEADSVSVSVLFNTKQSISEIINISSGSGNNSSSCGSEKKISLAQFYSSTTTNSGSDNKASDNYSAAAAYGSARKSSNASNKMKPNAKELTLISAKPDDGVAGSAGGTVATTSNDAAAHTPTVAASTPAIAKETKETKTLSYDGKRKVSKINRQRDENMVKNSENLPTDMSDSSDSDENKIPFVATAECNSTHEGRQLVHTILPINIETLFNLLFSKSKFLVDFHAMRKSTDMLFGDWTANEEGQQTRTVNVTVQIAASVGPKTSKVTEYQVIRDCSKPAELYSIDINSVNAGIPYADSFSVLMHYCLVRTVDDHTMLSVHAQIKYKKSIWGVVKGFIEKNTWAGLEDFYTSLLHSLQSETNIPPAKGKGRRPRRGTAAQIRPLEDTAPAILAKPESTEKALAPHSSLHSTTNQVLPVAHSSKYKWLSFFVIVLLFLLIVLNVILTLKLLSLENRIEDDYNERARLPNLSALKQLPNTPQDWIELVRQQEILHEVELKKWHKVLQAAIELLKKTEKTLAQLMFR